MKIKHLCLVLTTILVFSALAAPAFACKHRCKCIDKYSPGYWKHNVTVYVDEKGSYAADYDDIKESAYSMKTYEAWIQVHIDGDFTLDDAYDDFWAKGPGVQSRRAQLAFWFNLAKAYS